MNAPIIVTIDMDKKCAECRKHGALGSGLCMRCAGNAMDGNRAMKSREGRSLQRRFIEILRQNGGKP